MYKEWLFSKPNEKNTRMRTLFTRAYDVEKKAYKWHISPSIKGEKLSWKNSTRDDALFLSTAVQLNSSDFSGVYVWLSRYFKISLDLDINDNTYTYNQCLNPKTKKDILNLVKDIDVDIFDIESIEEDVFSKEIFFLVEKLFPYTRLKNLS